MAETSGPFDPVDPQNPGPGETLAEAEWELMLSHLVDGVLGGPGSSNLQASPSGATARGVDIAAGHALARAHWYHSSDVITHTSSANAAGAPRIDRAVLRLDRSANTVTQELLTGTAGAGPPALTDNATVTERPLWRWTIAPGATTVSGLTDERQWLSRTVRPCTSTNRPLDPQQGDLAAESDTGRIIQWTGTAWRTVYEDLTAEANLTPTTNWSAAGVCKASRRADGLVEITLNLIRINEPFHGATEQGSPLFQPMPGIYRPKGWTRWDVAHVTPNNQVRLRVDQDGVIWADNPTARVDPGRALRRTFSYTP